MTELDERSFISLSDSITRPANATQYAALDVISEVTTNDHFTLGKDGKAITFPSVGQGGIITGARLLSSQAHATVLPDIDVWLFHTDIAEVADNAAFAPTDAEMATLLTILEFSSWVKGTVTAGADGNSISVLNDQNKSFILESHEFMYGQMVVQNTYTPVASEIFTISLDITRFGH